MMFAIRMVLMSSADILLPLFVLLLLPRTTFSCASNNVDTAFCFVDLPPITKTTAVDKVSFSLHETQHTLSQRSRLTQSIPTFCRRRSNTCSEKRKKDHFTLFATPSTASGRIRNQPPERTVVILYHKPRNIITSHSNADAVSAATLVDNPGNETTRTTVYEDIETMQGYVASTADAKTNANPVSLSFQEVTGIQSKWHAIGRLDADTTGLLLLTNDGGLVHHATNPTSKSHGDLTTDGGSSSSSSGSGAITKTYEALIMGHHSGDDSEALEQIRTRGVDIGAKYGGWTKPAISLEVLDHPTPKSTLVSITIAEGKNRQVRRMFHGVQSGVMQLHRSKFGQSLDLGELQEGQWRILSDDEVFQSLHWEPRILQSSSYHNTQSRTKSSRGSNGPRQKRRSSSSRKKGQGGIPSSSSSPSRRKPSKRR